MPESKEKKAGDLYKEWVKSHDKDVWDKLISRLDPVIKTGIKNFGENDSSLRPRAYLLASQAIKNFDPKRGANLGTHVYGQLRPLTRLRNERKSAISIPENVRADSQRVFGFISSFRSDTGREPSLQEIGDSLGMSYKKINKALQTGRERSPERFKTESGDLAGGEKRSYSDIYADYLYHDLDPVDQKIFEHKTGYMDMPVKSNIELAETLGMSPSAVSQRIKKIQDKIQKGLQ